MTNPIADFGKARTLLVTGSNTSENHPIIAHHMRRAIRRGTKLLLLEPRDIPLAGLATVWLRHRPGTDVAVLNAMMNVIVSEDLHDHQYIQERTEGFEEFRRVIEQYSPQRAQEISGVSADDIVLAARIYASERPSSIAYAMGITQHVTGTDNVKSLANLAMLCGNVGVEGGGVNPLRGQNNVQGACDMGALPNVFSGYQQVADLAARQKMSQAWGVPFESLPDKPGLTITEILDGAESGQVKALYIMGENPMLSDPDSGHVEKALGHLDFLVVQDIFLTETARLADVVLPAAAYAEREGTYTNTERRVQLSRQAVPPPGQARPDWQIISELARRLDHGWNYSSAEEIFTELAVVTPQYRGITYERLRQGEQLCWPCPTPGHPGTPILHVGRFARGLGKFHAIEYLPPAELPDKKYPLLLTTGRVLQHFHTGTMTRKAAGLEALAPRPFIEVNPADARRLGISGSAPVRVISRRGQIELEARIDERVDCGVVFIPFHYFEAAANRLTNTALDPVAKIPEFKVCAVRLERAG